MNKQTNAFELPVADHTAVQPVTMQDPRMAVFSRLVDDIPVNDYDLPRYLYAPQFITEDFFDQDFEEQTSILNCAVIAINYNEGFPAFTNTAPLWSQMEGEDDDMHRAFNLYLKQTDTMPIRQLIAIDHPTLSSTDIRLGYSYYSWAARSRAHDLFALAAHQKMRERRIMSTNDSIFLKSEQLFKGLEVYFNLPGDEEGMEDEDGNVVTGTLRWIEELTPAVAIKMIETLNKIQRVSLGLNPNGDRNAADTPANADTDVLMQTLVQASRNPNVVEVEEGKVPLDVLLDDPKTAELAQRLLVQVSMNDSGGELS